MRTLIVDDQRLFAEVIEVTVSALGMEVLGVAADAAGALEAVERLQPELVLLELDLPDRDGIQTAQEILETFPGTRVVALTGLDDGTTERDALRAGCTDFITKRAPMVEFARILTGLADGRDMPRRIAHGTSAAGSDRIDPLARQLTRRELEVLGLLALGTPSSSIAERMGVTPNTVRTHVQGILTKLQVHSRLEAVAYATSRRIVSEAS